MTRQQVAYFAVDDPVRWRADHCPIYIFSAEPHIYGFPIWEKPGHIKVALEMIDSTTDPDLPEKSTAQMWTNFLRSSRHSSAGQSDAGADRHLLIHGNLQP
ncbi:MAG: hypothetical protein R2932_46560 [Caldilineaceae bacterium]